MASYGFYSVFKILSDKHFKLCYLGRLSKAKYQLWSLTPSSGEILFLHYVQWGQTSKETTGKIYILFMIFPNCTIILYKEIKMYHNAKHHLLYVSIHLFSTIILHRLWPHEVNFKKHSSRVHVISLTYITYLYMKILLEIWNET